MPVRGCLRLRPFGRQPWNELADSVAKHISVVGTPKFAPPVHIAMQAKNIDWEWAWMQTVPEVRRQFPRQEAHCLVWQPRDTTCTLSPQQLIPTHGVLETGVVETAQLAATIDVQGLTQKYKLVQAQMQHFA